MCGDIPPRPSAGGRIAVMFPPSSSSSSAKISPYTLLFHNDDRKTRTRATFKVDDARTMDALRRCNRVDLRIERHGDLTSTDSALHQPLHSFSLDTRGQTMEFELPERLDLGISETGIVGRQVTLLSRNVLLGTGIVGWN